jgi:predicted nucleic acid-binding protein
MSAKPFFDTSVAIYAVTADPERTPYAQELLADGGMISVQVLNEMVSVLRRKFNMEWEEVELALTLVHDQCPGCSSMTTKTHQAALKIAREYRYHIYDSLLIASALQSGCSVLYSEDMQDGQRIEGLTIRNPFVQTAS